MLRFLHFCYFAAILRGVRTDFLHLQSVRNIELLDDDSYTWPSHVNKTGCKVTRTEIFYQCTKDLNKSTSQIQDVSQLLKMRVDCRGAEGFQHNFTLIDGKRYDRPTCSSWAYKKYDVFGGSLRPERDPTRKWLPWFSGDIITVWKEDVLDFECVLNPISLPRTERSMLERQGNVHVWTWRKQFGMIRDGDMSYVYRFGGFALHMTVLDVGAAESCFDSLEEAWAWNLDRRIINNVYYLRLASPAFGSLPLPKMEIDTWITGDVFFADKDSLKIGLVQATSEDTCDNGTPGTELKGLRLKGLAKLNASFYHSEIASDNFHVDLQVIIAGLGEKVDCIGMELAVIFPLRKKYVYIERLPQLPNHNHSLEESGVPHLWLIVLMCILVIFLLALGFVCWPKQRQDARPDECTAELAEM